MGEFTGFGSGGVVLCFILEGYRLFNIGSCHLWLRAESVRTSGKRSLVMLVSFNVVMGLMCYCLVGEGAWSLATE